MCLSKLPAALLRAPWCVKLAVPFILTLMTLRKLRPALIVFATLFFFLEHAVPEKNASEHRCLVYACPQLVTRHPHLLVAFFFSLIKKTERK